MQHGLVATGEWSRPYTAFTVACVLLAGIYTLGAAYGTDVLELQLRFVFWLLIAVLTVGQLLVIFRVVINCLFVNARWKILFGAAIAVVATSFALAGELTLLKSLPVSPIDPSPYFKSVWCLFPSVGLIGLGLLLWRPTDFNNRQVSMPGGNDDSTTVPAVKTMNPKPPLATVERNASSAPTMNQEWPVSPPDWVQAQDHYLYLRYCSGSATVAEIR